MVEKKELTMEEEKEIETYEQTQEDFEDNFSQGEADLREREEYFSMEEERRISDLLESE